MLVSVENLDLYTSQGYRGASFMSGEQESGLIFRAASGDAEARLRLVKQHLDTVVEIAAMYASEKGRSFPHLVKAGTLAVVRAADGFHHSQQLEFADYLRYEIIRTLEGIE